MAETLRDVRLDLAALTRDATLGQAARAMDANGLPMLPIIGADRKLVGILTAESLLGALERPSGGRPTIAGGEGTPSPIRQLADLANRSIEPQIEKTATCEVGITVAQAHGRLLDAPGGCLVVVDEDGRFVGTLTRQRLFTHLLIPEEPTESLELVCVCGHRANEHHTLGLCPCEIDGCNCPGYEAVAEAIV